MSAPVGRELPSVLLGPDYADLARAVDEGGYHPDEPDRPVEYRVLPVSSDTARGFIKDGIGDKESEVDLQGGAGLVALVNTVDADALPNDKFGFKSPDAEKIDALLLLTKDNVGGRVVGRILARNTVEKDEARLGALVNGGRTLAALMRKRFVLRTPVS